ncbi:MAG: poly-gamma-glutamate biosynthesis protein PgsC/CapC [Alphaproteobacteria bacterium]|nr:poly-gamma-glutamate biosynthesis protein PgsC/CapC [Alphaproteobacteria bacterium]
MVDLFPTSVLDNSILTSVLLGLLITWIFQETLGWNFTGLVVPGYLASIFAIQPETGAVVVIEAGMTYAFVYWLSDLTPTHWPTSRLFGRDRFFALLLGSVTIRLLVEGIGLDAIAAWLDRPLSPALHSMGLLVMPLGANALWRTGMGRGVLRLGVPVLLTWFLLTWVLLPYTNLSMTSFELTYEDLAVDFVTSPKAYMLLLAGAWLGSVTNREYGFDYGGIIVPGLLSVCWLWPARVASTFGEAFLVWGLLALLVRLPAVRNANLTGGRLMVLAFVSIYLVKLGLGWAVGFAWPGARIHDLFGFGYLLPTLMGLRMHKHGEPFRFAVPTLVCSLAGFLGAGTLGYALAWLLPPRFEVAPAPAEAEVVLAAYANQGRIPSRAQIQDTVSGGDGFGTLVRRAGSGPALVARVGSPGLAQAVLDLAPVLDSRAVLLCAPEGAGCEVGLRALQREGAVWRVEATVVSYLQARGDDLEGVDMAALTSVLPDLTLRAGAAEVTRLGLGASARARDGADSRDAPLVRLDPDENAPPFPLGAQRAVRFELAAAMARFAAGDDLGEGMARRSAAWFAWGVEREGDVLVLAGEGVHAQVRRGARPLVVHVPEAQNPGVLPFALQLASALEARAILVDAPPAIEHGSAAGTRPAHALATGLLEAWPDARVLEIRGLRDVYDLEGSWGWSVGREASETPALVAEVEALLGSAPVPYQATLDDQVLRRRDTPLRWARDEGDHVVLMVDTRLRHRFVAFDELEGLERRWALLGRSLPMPEWAALWDLPIREMRTRREVERVEGRLQRAGIGMRLRCTRSDQCGWVELERCEDGRCERTWLPRYRGLPEGDPLLQPAAMGRE